MKLLILLPVALLFFSNVLHAEWYGYCWGQKNRGSHRFCKQLEPKTFRFEKHCKDWARSYGAYKWGNKTGTNPEALRNNQQRFCDRIIPGPNPNPNSFTCYVENSCPNDSSINPLGNIQADNPSQAIAQCVVQYRQDYLHALTNNSQDNCYTKIQVSAQ